MTTYVVSFVEQRDPVEVEAPTRAKAFQKARQRYDATPNVVKEHLDDSVSEEDEPTYDSGYVQNGSVPP